MSSKKDRAIVVSALKHAAPYIRLFKGKVFVLKVGGEVFADAEQTSLLMEQVLAPRFNFTAKSVKSGPVEGFDYGEDGYDPKKENVGFDKHSGQFQIEIKGLAEPKSEFARRICSDDLNEVITAFVQDKTTIERGLFDEELVPEELTQVRMGKIVGAKFPELDAEDQEAVRQHAVAALNLTQKAKEIALSSANDPEINGNTALIDGVRKFAMDVRELDIDLIDRINPFGEAYAILAKSMSEESLKQVAAVISAKKVQLSPEEARDLCEEPLRLFAPEPHREARAPPLEQAVGTLTSTDSAGHVSCEFSGLNATSD